MSQWQDIKTAPKDGTVIFVFGRRIGRNGEAAIASVDFRARQDGGRWVGVIIYPKAAFQGLSEESSHRDEELSLWRPMIELPA